MWVAWIRHQRCIDRRRCRAASRTGRCPEQARQSSTSFTCSATWMWIGPCGAAAQTARSVSGVTARSECGAMPSCAPGRPRDDLRGCARPAARNRSGSLRKRRCPAIGARAAEAAMGVERRQQREADAGRRAGGGDARGHLAEIGIGRAVDVVVQIVELADRGEAGLQHLHVGEGGDRLDVVGREPREEAVHHLAPGPEAVGAGPRRSASAAMPRWKAWLCRFGMPGSAMPAMCSAPRACAPGVTRAIAPSSIRDAHVVGPARRQQRVIEEQHRVATGALADDVSTLGAAAADMYSDYARLTTRGRACAFDTHLARCAARDARARQARAGRDRGAARSPRGWAHRLRRRQTRTADRLGRASSASRSTAAGSRPA